MNVPSSAAFEWDRPLSYITNHHQVKTSAALMVISPSRSPEIAVTPSSTLTSAPDRITSESTSL